MMNKHLYGDCLQVMKMIPDASVDMIFSDLPFNTTNAHWDCEIDLDLLWMQYKRIVKPNAAIVLFAQTPFDKILGCSNLEQLRYEWIWEKTSATGHLNANESPMKAHENILVFYDKLPIYKPQKTTGHKRKISTATHKRNSTDSEVYGKCNIKTTYDSTERYPRSVLLFPSDKQTSKWHSTQKPVALLEYFIKTYTDEGMTVLDSCAGSCSTGVACMNLNRKYILIEKDKNIYWQGKLRLIQHKEKLLR